MIYVWDPLIAHFGGYQTTSSVNGYKSIPGSANYNPSFPITNKQLDRLTNTFYLMEPDGKFFSFEITAISESNRYYRFVLFKKQLGIACSGH